MRRRRRKMAYKDLLGPPYWHGHNIPPCTHHISCSKALDAAPTAANLQQRARPHHPQHLASPRPHRPPRNHERHLPRSRQPRRASRHDIPTLNKRQDSIPFPTTFRRRRLSRRRRRACTDAPAHRRPDLRPQQLDGSRPEPAHPQLHPRRQSRARQRFSHSSSRGEDGGDLAD